MTRKTKILIPCLLILLLAGLLAYGALDYFANRSSGREDESAKMAELEAALTKAASTGGAKQDQPDKIRQTQARQVSRTRST